MARNASNTMLIILFLLWTRCTFSSEEEQKHECGLWFAPSTIPNGGMGMFAGRNYKEGTNVQTATWLVNTDYNLHNDAKSGDEEQVMEHYNWTPNGPFVFESLTDSFVICTDVGSLANNDADRQNISQNTRFRPDYHDMMFDQHVDPGAGAISYYSSPTIIMKDIVAGQELFLDYGYEALDDENRARDGIQSLEWLAANGQCLDNIEKKRSTIYQAGFGAFTTRDLKKGSIIAPAPLFHINDISYFNKYEMEWDEDWFVSEKYAGKQLMINYCFSHPRSSLVLCMMSQAAMINHMSSRNTGNEDGPNAYYTWSTWDDQTQIWIRKPLEDLKKQKNRVLSLDIVALRDIEEGEEIFIDYGDEWDHAWNRHVMDLKNSISTLSQSSIYEVPIPLTSYTRMHQGRPFKTERESRSDPYPPNISTSCYLWFNETAETSRGSIVPSQNLDLATKEMISSFGISGDYLKPEAILPGFDTAERPCKVLDRNNDNMSYTVRIYEGKLVDEEEEWFERRKSIPTIIANFPELFINFVHRPYTSHLHLASAFRHTIEFNDDAFPEQWMDKI